MTATTVVRLLADHYGQAFTLEGRAAGGEVGAYFARRSDGRRVVFKWFERLEWREDLTRMLVRLERLRARGYPIPLHEPLIAIPGALVVVQEAIDSGDIVDRISHRLLDQILELNDLQVGDEGVGEEWWAFMLRTLTSGADGWCLHEPLRQHSSRSLAIIERVEALGTDLASQSLLYGDIVHMDFHHRNILQTGDQALAVIDWEGSMSGDRIFDLVTLGFCAGVADTEAGIEDRIWTAVRRSGDPAAVAGYVCHMAVRRLDWTIRHHPSEVAYWLERSERFVAEFA